LVSDHHGTFTWSVQKYHTQVIATPKMEPVQGKSLSPGVADRKKFME
jgi:hypothetical protein